MTSMLSQYHTVKVTVVTAEEFAELRDNGQIFTQYVDFDGKLHDSKYNPNGSVNARSKVSQVRTVKFIGKMGHSERFEHSVSSKIFQEIKTSISLH